MWCIVPELIVCCPEWMSISDTHPSSLPQVNIMSDPFMFTNLTFWITPLCAVISLNHFNVLTSYSIILPNLFAHASSELQKFILRIGDSLILGSLGLFLDVLEVKLPACWPVPLRL